MDAKSRLEVCCGRDSSNVESTPAAGDPKARLSPPSSSSPALPSPKRSRRSADKRVVWMPIADAKASGSRTKGASESAPPSDSWAWRKYGQKPIKGSPYPRGYYRCSSSKGCPARKQVERSHADPGMLVVTYSSEHNHSWPLPKSNNNNSRAARVVSKEDSVPEPEPDLVLSESDPSDDVVPDKFSGLIYADDQTLMAMPDDFWYPDVGSTSSTSPVDDGLLFGPIFGSELSLDDCAKSGGGGGGGGGDGNNGEEEKEDALFEGLGELPEYSVVFRRSHVERQMAAG